MMEWGCRVMAVKSSQTVMAKAAAAARQCQQRQERRAVAGFMAIDRWLIK